ncbi:hypothetical protein [Nonomuraea turcica]|uniref:hypothetical protein n=1 Tax=Nonomuraea sp. G32 TaxID=3067274 RepID=UPI00273B1D32|nr:hypothetical protein [Nonomuraea sp. G32]MDP4504036.1 hypothetical protein [Nonomuraea sp. G32]
MLMTEQLSASPAVQPAESGRGDKAMDRMSRSWLWRLGVRKPSAVMVGAVSRQCHRCQAGSWRALATEYLVRRGIVPDDAAVQARWAVWRDYLVTYARATGNTRGQTAEDWADQMLSWGGPDKTFHCQLPRPVVALVWLDILGQKLTVEKINAVAPTVPKAKGLTWQTFQAWKDVVARGQVPTPKAVRQALKDVQRPQSPRPTAGPRVGGRPVRGRRGGRHRSGTDLVRGRGGLRLEP